MRTMDIIIPSTNSIGIRPIPRPRGVVEDSRLLELKDRASREKETIIITIQMAIMMAFLFMESINLILYFLKSEHVSPEIFLHSP